MGPGSTAHSHAIASPSSALPEHRAEVASRSLTPLQIIDGLTPGFASDSTFETVLIAAFFPEFFEMLRVPTTPPIDKEWDVFALGSR